MAKGFGRAGRGLAVAKSCLIAMLIGVASPATAQVFPALPPETGQLNSSGVEETANDVLRSSTVIILRNIETRAFDALSRGRRFGPGGPGSTPDLDDEGEQQSLRRARPGYSAGKDGDGSWYIGRLGIWANPAVSFIENDFESTAFDGFIITPLIGADYLIDDGIVVGLSLGYEGTRLDTDFNNGELDSDGFVITPYAGWAPHPNVQLTAGFSYTALEFDSAQALLGTTATGDFSGNRLAGFVRATGFAPNEWHGIEPLTLSAGIGTRLARQRQEEHVNSLGLPVAEEKSYLGQLNLALRADYAIGLTPSANGTAYLEGGFNYDYRQSETEVAIGTAVPSDDRTEGTIAVGFDAALSGGVSMGVEYLHVLGREDVKSRNLSFNLRVDF
ncbi:MAG: autotransporter outer membrane beta-barrel domain-containing protein [Pseudomonadota bacterium]